MAGPDYTTTGLIASVKRRITLPDAQNLYSDADLVAFMGDELSSTVVPLVHTVQQEYWVMKTDVTMVQDQTNYTIPVRGVANGLRLLTMLVPNGNNSASQNEINFPLIRPENVSSTYNWLSPYSLNTLYGFYMEDDHVVCFPTQVVNQPVNALRFRYEREPSQPCLVENACQIVSLDGAGVVTVSNIPSDWTTTLSYDLTKPTPAFTPKMDDMTLTTINTGTTQLTFSNLPTNAAVGDWISVANTCPVLQMPYQMYPYLAQCVANLCMAGLADTQPYEDGKKKEAQMKEDLLKLMQPRDMGNVQTVINRDGLFDNGAFWGWGGSNMYW
jgi:hypothetical protein